MRWRTVTVGGLMAIVAGAGIGLGGYELGRRTIEEPELVWIAPRSERYHRGDCRYIRFVGTRATVAEAKKYYRPCSVCRP